MTDEPDAPAVGAIVDDFFWLGRAKDLVIAGAALRSEAAKQLMSALAWLWTVYTGAAVLTARLSTVSGRVEALLLAAPSLFIVLAYVGAIYAYLPLSVEFDPQDPDDVRRAHTDAVTRGWRRMRVALALCGLAAVSLGVAIGVVAVQR